MSTIDATKTRYALDTVAIRIALSDDDARWELDWSYRGRADLQGLGWVAELTAYQPTEKHDLARKFLPEGGSGFLEVSAGEIVLEYKNLYVGGSKYSYDKHGGASGYVVIQPDGTAEFFELKGNKKMIVSILVKRAAAAAHLLYPGSA